MTYSKTTILKFPLLTPLVKKYLTFSRVKSIRPHRFSTEINPWLTNPLSSAPAAHQHHNLLLAAQQQSLQHTLLKHILASHDLNSRVRGIAAYEEYEALLRVLKDNQYAVSQDVFDTIVEQMCQKISAIFDNHPRHQQRYAELQRKILSAAWLVAKELTDDESKFSPHLVRIKKIQHCWLHYKPAKQLV